LGLLALIGILLGPARWAQAQDAEKMVELLEKQRQSVRTLHQVTETAVEYQGGKRTSIDELWLQRDGDTYKQRLVKSAKPKGQQSKPQGAGLSASVMVCDGEFTWTETKLADQVLVIKSPALTEDNFSELRQAVETGSVAIKQEQMVNKLKCVVLEARGAGGAARGTTTYWVSKRYGLQLKRVTITPDGKKTVLATRTLEVNEPIAEDRFSYAPPAGAQIIEMGAAPQGR